MRASTEIDEDGYPTDAALVKVSTWEAKAFDWRPFMAYVKSLWMYKEWGWSEDGDLYKISTGGWSGNESLIQGMKKNTLFWSACWQGTRRGGHYEFKMPMWML